MTLNIVKTTNTYRTLLKWTAAASVLISAIAAVVFEPEVPVVSGLLAGIGLVWLRRPGIGGVIYTGIVFLLIGLVLLVLFQNIAELRYPASTLVFVFTGARLVLTLTAIFAAVGTLALRAGTHGPPILGIVAAVALSTFVIVGVASRIAEDGDARHSGDLVVTITRETTWSPRELSASPGPVSVYVRNDDVHHGSFTIDGVTDLDVPAGTSKRTSFSLEPGRYRFYSKLYPGEPEMRGTLIVD